MKQFLFSLFFLIFSFSSSANTQLSDNYLNRASFNRDALQLAEDTMQKLWGEYWLGNEVILPKERKAQIELAQALLFISRASKRLVPIEKLDKTSQMALEYTQQLAIQQYYADALLQRGRIVGLYMEQMEEARVFTEQSLEVSRTLVENAPSDIDLINLHLDILTQLGKLLTHIEEAEKARPFLLEALAIAEQQNNKEAQVHLLNSISFGFKLTDRIDLGLDYQYRALRLAQELSNPVMKADSLRNIGLTYKHLGELQKAQSNITEALSIYKQLNNSRRIAKALNYLGTIYNETGQLNQAIAVFIESLSIYEELNYHYGIGLLSYNLSEAYQATDELQRAESYNEKAIDEFKLIGHNPYLREALIQGSTLQDKQNNPRLALDYALQAIQLLPQDASSEQLSEIRTSLAKLLKSQGETKQLVRLMELELTALSKEKEMAQTPAEDIKQTHEMQRLRNELNERTAALQQSKRQADSFFNWISWSLVVATGVTLLALGLFLQLRVQRRLTANANRQLCINQVTGLQNEVDLQHKLHPRLLSILKQWEVWYSEDRSDPPPEQCQFLLVYCEFMDDLYTEFGFAKGKEIEKAFGQFIQERFGDNEQVIQFRDNTLFVVAPAGIPTEVAKQTLQLLNRFSAKYALRHKHFSVAMMDFPFLQRSGRATGEESVSDILLIGLNAARQLSKKFSESAWVKLNAIDATPASFLTQRPRKNVIVGIDKGYIKIEASHDKQEISWPSGQV